MKILQKFAAVLVFCSAVLVASSADARVVQICDMGAYALYNDSNAVLAGIGNPYRLNNLKHVGKMSPDSYYDLYVAGIGGGGEGAVISFFCNGKREQFECCRLCWKCARRVDDRHGGVSR